MKCKAYKVDGMRKGEHVLILLPCPVWLKNGDTLVLHEARKMAHDVAKNKYVAEPKAVERKALRYGYWEVEPAQKEVEAVTMVKEANTKTVEDVPKKDKSMKGKGKAKTKGKK